MKLTVYGPFERSGWGRRSWTTPICHCSYEGLSEGGATAQLLLPLPCLALSGSFNRPLASTCKETDGA